MESIRLDVPPQAAQIAADATRCGLGSADSARPAGYTPLGSLNLGRGSGSGSGGGSARGLGLVSAVRHWAIDLIGADHPAAYDVGQCLAEMYANSLQHTDSDTVSVTVLSPGSEAGPEVGSEVVRVEVADAGVPGREPHLRARPGNDEFEQWRGLHIVHALTGGRWGSWFDPEGGRRTTWFEIGH